MTILELKQVCIFINSILPLKISDIAIKYYGVSKCIHIKVDLYMN